MISSLPRTFIHLIPIIMVAIFACLGCGTSQYDQLAKARAETLRQGAAAGVHVDEATWTPYQSPQNYTVEFPGPPRPALKNDGATITEQLKVTVGETVYELNYIHSNVVDMKRVADEMGAALTEMGYRRTGGTTRNTNNLVRQDVQYELPDKSSQAKLRIYELDTESVCALSVIGKEINNADLARFFDSVHGGA